jgi:hypothetical protein
MWWNPRKLGEWDSSRSALGATFNSDAPLESLNLSLVDLH